MSLREQVLEDMPIEYRDRFAAVLDQTASDARVLDRELAEYMEAVRRLAALTNLDVTTLERIGQVLERMVAAHDGLGPEQRSLVQAAVRYFVTEDDDEEITGVLAFDDDIQVINAVSRAIARDDLVLPYEPVALD